MGLLRRAKSLTSHSGVKHLGNSSHAVHGPSNPKPANPIKTGKRMANHVQAPHKPDSSPFGAHAAQLANAKTALASGTPYNPRAKRKIQGVIGTGKHAATHSSALHNTGPYSGRHRSGY